MPAGGPRFGFSESKTTRGWPIPALFAGVGTPQRPNTKPFQTQAEAELLTSETEAQATSPLVLTVGNAHSCKVRKNGPPSFVMELTKRSFAAKGGPPAGTCPMCKLEKKLVRSHLLPAAAYEYFHAGEHRPIITADGALIPSDRQIQDYLLCKPCEDILNDGGEHGLVDKLASYDGKFPLYKALTNAPPLFDVHTTKGYLTADKPDVQVERLIHLGMGIFWKASVHSWRGETTTPRIELGPYENRVRTWLRGESDFPQDVFLLINFISPEFLFQINMFPPYRGQGHEWHSFYMTLPGIIFMLHVGKTVSNDFKSLSVHATKERLVMVSEAIFNNFKAATKQQLQTMRKTNAFVKAMEKIAKEKGEAFTLKR